MKISWRKKNWSQVPDGLLTPGQTGRLTVGRKLTANATNDVCFPRLGIIGMYVPFKIAAPAKQGRFFLPLEILQCAHRSAICTQLSTFRIYTVI
jgi:hypothetical protein